MPSQRFLSDFPFPIRFHFQSDRPLLEDLRFCEIWIVSPCETFNSLPLSPEEFDLEVKRLQLMVSSTFCGLIFRQTPFKDTVVIVS